MTQEEWDASSHEKRVLHLFLSAMSEISGRSGKRMREAILELVADMPEDLRVLPLSDLDRGLLEQVLAALEDAAYTLSFDRYSTRIQDAAIASIRARLEQKL